MGKFSLRTGCSLVFDFAAFKPDEQEYLTRETAANEPWVMSRCSKYKLLGGGIALIRFRALCVSVTLELGKEKKAWEEGFGQKKCGIYRPREHWAESLRSGRN